MAETTSAAAIGLRRRSWRLADDQLALGVRQSLACWAMRAASSAVASRCRQALQFELGLLRGAHLSDRLVDHFGQQLDRWRGCTCVIQGSANKALCICKHPQGYLGRLEMR